MKRFLLIAAVIGAFLLVGYFSANALGGVRVSTVAILLLVVLCVALWARRGGARLFNWLERWSPLYKLIEMVPECARFPNQEQRRASILDTRRALVRDNWYLILAILWIVPVVFMGQLLASAFAHLIPVLPPDVWWAIILVGWLVAFFAIAWLVFRAKVRRQLRAHLLALGVPICIHCGYDLRGQTEPRCPECGRPFDPSMLRSAEKAANKP